MSTDATHLLTSDLATVGTGEQHQLVTFQVGSLLLGIDVMKVQELIRYQEMTKVPLASAVVEGLINLRGEILTAIDLRRRFSLPPRPASAEPPMNVVVRTEGGIVSFLVDHIGDVVEVGPAQHERTPATIRQRYDDLVAAVYKLERDLLLVLDVEQAATV
ncbi:MAG: chemotaxis protein CheW [Bdellovibrionales bacterium]|nr:chemotaxis protein CheW [Bdellovibrionales bacterium]